MLVQFGFYFGCRELRAEEGPTPVQSLDSRRPPASNNGGQEVLQTRKSQKQQLSSGSRLEIGHWCGLTSVILIVLNTVNLQFQGCLFPIFETSSQRGQLT